MNIDPLQQPTIQNADTEDTNTMASRSKRLWDCLSLGRMRATFAALIWPPGLARRLAAELGRPSWANRHNSQRPDGRLQFPGCTVAQLLLHEATAA